MRYLAALLALVSFAGQAAVVTWTNPTSYTDGTVLASADIASTTIEWATTSAFVSVAGSQVVAGAATSATVPDPAAGVSRCYRAKTTTTAAKGGLTSGPSNVSCKTGSYSAPNPPSIVDVVLAWVRAMLQHRFG
jgi:hypothetical protein